MMDTPEHLDYETVSSPSTQKRQRAKQACEPCRLRKRRCDGAMPCNMCRQFEYDCYFEKHPRKRSKIVENAHQGLSGDHVRAEPPKEDQSNVEDVLKMRNMEANSGMAFTRSLGQRLDPSSAPKLFTFGWNLGYAAYSPPPSASIADVLNEDQMFSLAQMHFQNTHLLYGFLDKEFILQQISLRYAQPERCQVPDHLFANLAAVGSLFLGGSLSSAIPAVVEAAKVSLDSMSLMQTPTLLEIQSWLLRTMYLRLTDQPHVVHMSGTIAMHLVETIGLHREEKDFQTLHPSVEDRTQHIEIRRRTFWCSRLINAWISFECGRTRVTLRGITTKLPTPQEGDHTVDFIRLYSLSCYLDPERADSKWEDFLKEIDEYEVKHDAIELSRANIGLCGYRRLRLSNPNPSPEILNRVIKMGLRGLEAARRLTEKGLPWWHVANVPFQALCVFLAMDVRESISHISTALHTLEKVAERFQTTGVKEALKTARFLIRLSKKRKDEDAEVLGQILRKDDANGTPQPENIRTAPPAFGHSIPYEHSPVAASGEDWTHDALKNYPEMDWNLFFTADMPDFSGFAPDAVA